MTSGTVFSDAEWELLVRLPKWVAQAAGAAQADGGRRTADEEEAGFLAVGNGRESGNPLVTRIAGRLLDIFDSLEQSTTTPAIDVGKPEAGAASVLEQAQRAARLLDAKADPADALAYRHWLVAIAETVVGAARSGDVLGIGGDTVSPSERRFLDRLAHALRG